MLLGRAFREYYQYDETAESEVCSSTSVNDDNRERIFGLYQSNLNGESMSSLAEEMSQTVHPKSRIHTWNPNVYAGVMERIDNSIRWNDILWNIPKPELLKSLAKSRTKH